jgi:flagellin
MTAKLRGISACVRNAHDGLSILEVAEGGINSISNAIQRIRELAIQSASATNNFDDRANLNLEANQLLSEIDRVASDTSFNGIKLLDGSFQNIPLQIGPDNNTNDSFQISIDSVKTSSMGVGSSTRTVSTSISISPPTTPSNTGASGTVSVSVSPVSVSESGSTNLTYTFTRTGDTSQELKVAPATFNTSLVKLVLLVRILHIIIVVIIIIIIITTTTTIIIIIANIIIQSDQGR